LLRLLLALVSILLLAACADGGASHPSPGVIIHITTPTPVPATPRATATPTPSPTPIASPTPAPSLQLAGGFPQQGGFLLVRLLNPPSGLSKATARFAGGSYPMLPEGDRWYAVIGIGTEFPAGDYALEVAADAILASTVVSVGPGEFPQEYLDLPPESSELLGDAAAIEEETRRLDQLYAGFTPQRLWSGAWVMPTEGLITNPFGLWRSINGGPLSPHTGTDIAAEEGAPVVAAASGRVALAGQLYLRGNSVIIDHGAGVFSGYHHLESVMVTEGQPVTTGDLVGYVGATGLVSGSHLHWEAIVGGVRVDPTLWTYRPVEP